LCIHGRFIRGGLGWGKGLRIISKLNGAWFEAGIEYIEFTRCDLSGSYIGESGFQNIRIEESNFRGVNFYASMFQCCQFIKSDLRGMTFNERMLTKEIVIKASIAGSMVQTTFEETILSDGETISYP
jgi:uncharacterized protein YjbI with pentapeptide repeats